MLETTSVFDVMAAEETDRRVSSRRALALAHTRVENHLGRFLTASVTMDEFDARLAAVRDQFAAYVADACLETGHDHPEHIAKSLVDHYTRNRRWQPRLALEDDDTEETEDDSEGDETSKPPWLKEKKSGENPFEKNKPDDDEDHDDEAENDDGKPPWLKKKKSNNPSDQDDDSSKLVCCPQCGGDGKSNGGGKCGKCGGKGKVANFGDSLLDHVARTADDKGKNTDLGGPEPTMNKKLWTPESIPQRPEEESGGRWPTKEKDPVEVIKAVNDDPLKEIGEGVTKTETLPTQTGDTPFADGGETKGPSDWQSGPSQADPVTKATQPE